VTDTPEQQDGLPTQDPAAAASDGGDTVTPDGVGTATATASPELVEPWYRNPAVIVAGVVVAAVVLAVLFLALRSGNDDPASSGVPTLESTGDERLDAALALHFQGDLDGAAEIYNEILETTPNNEYALYNLGLIAQVQGSVGEAIGYYDRSLAIDPNLFAAAYNRGLALRDLGQIDEAIEALETLAAREGELTPDELGRTLFNLGNLYIAKGDAEQGVPLVERGVELNPELRGD